MGIENPRVATSGVFVFHITWNSYILLPTGIIAYANKFFNMLLEIFKVYTYKPSGPPNWLMIAFAICASVRLIFTGYCSLFS